MKKHSIRKNDGGVMRLFPYDVLFYSILILAILFLYSCVDVDSPNISTVDLRTLTKFVYLSSSTDTLQIRVDGVQAAELANGGETSFLNLPAGSRRMVFIYNGGLKIDTAAVALPHDEKIVCYCIFEPSAGDTQLIRQTLSVHTTYDGEVQYIPNKALVRFLNYSRVDAEFVLLSNDTTTTDPLTFGKGTMYDTVAVAPNFIAINSGTGDTLVHSKLVNASAGRYSVLLYGSGTSIQDKVIKED